MASLCAQNLAYTFEDRAAKPGGEHDCTRSVVMASRELEHGGHTPRLVGKWRIDVLLLSNDSEDFNGTSASGSSDGGTHVGTALASGVCRFGGAAQAEVWGEIAIVQHGEKAPLSPKIVKKQSREFEKKTVSLTDPGGLS